METIGDVTEMPGEIIFEWRIKDFLSLADKIDTRYKSPKFYFSGASWEIWIYPNGESEDDTGGWIGIYVMRISSGLPLLLTYSLALKSADNKAHPGIKNTITFTEKGAGYGKNKVLSRKLLEEKKPELLPLGTLTVICTMKSDEITAVGDSYFSELQKLSDDFKEIYLEAKKTDCLFKVEPQNIGAHRLVLETRSPVLAAMFKSDRNENQSGEVSVTDMDRETLGAILIYIYSGDTTKLKPDNVFQIYAAAEKYDMKYIKKICSQFIIRNLSVESVCDVIKFSEKYQDKELGQRAREYFKENADKILETDKWENFVKENHNISVELLATIVKSLFKK